MNWAHIDINGAIREYGSLPKNWGNISNFFVLESNKDKLKTLGWYVLVDITQPITNNLIQYHGAPEYWLDENEGIVKKNCQIITREEPIVIPTQPEEIVVYTREQFFIDLRKERNKRLTASDWTQTVDLQSIKSAEWISAWAEYRQILRDLPQLYEQEQYLHITNLDHVDWPIIPELS